MSSALLNTDILGFPNLLSKMYTNECFLYRILNKILRSKNLTELKYLFPYYICFQSALEFIFE